eukprot:9221959-Karenia_brevis.AAC.1
MMMMMIIIIIISIINIIVLWDFTCHHTPPASSASTSGWFCIPTGSSFDATMLEARNSWSKRNNVEIMGDGDRVAVRPPSKFSALGQPNDGWHMFFHMLDQLFQRLCIRWVIIIIISMMMIIIIVVM